MQSFQRVSNMFKKNEFYLLIIFAGLCLFLSVRTGGLFASPENLMDMVTSVAPSGIMAAGVLVVLITGGIDISFTAEAAVIQYMTGYLLLNVEGISPVAVIGAALAAGLLMGLLNSTLIHFLKVPAIIVTIAMMNVYYGILIWISGGKLMNQFPGWFSVKTTWSTAVLPVLLLLLVMLLTSIILHFTKIGRYILAYGGNRQALERAGVSSLKVSWFAYGYLGVMSQTVAPTSVFGTELEILAMVLLGGAALTGGRGSALGTILGVLVLGASKNALVLLGISSYWFDLITGVIILVSFCLSGIIGRSQRKGIPL